MDYPTTARRRGQSIHSDRPGYLRLPDGIIPAGFKVGQVFAPSEERTSPLCVSIEDGLKLSGFKESENIRVVRIPTVIQNIKEGAQLLPGHLRRPHALVTVTGSESNSKLEYSPA